MQSALIENGSLRLLSRCQAYGYWKGPFKRELAIFLEQERIRMAQSQDWSDLGKYVRASLLIRGHLAALDVAGLLFTLRVPAAQALCAAAVEGILGSIRRLVVSEH